MPAINQVRGEFLGCGIRLDYPNLDKIDQQAKQVVLYTGKPDDTPPPAKDYVINMPDAMPKLTAEEWHTVRERSKSYGQMLGRA